MIKQYILSTGVGLILVYCACYFITSDSLHQVWVAFLSMYAASQLKFE